jgi:hypothetical protein
MDAQPEPIRQRHPRADFLDAQPSFLPFQAAAEETAGRDEAERHLDALLQHDGLLRHARRHALDQ